MTEDADGTGDPDGELDRLLFECLDRPEAEWISALEERCAAHPRHAATLRRRFGMLARLGMADGSLDAAQAETVSGPGAKPRGIDLPGYSVGEVMGGGSMGIVYGGIRDESGEPVAIKVLHGHLLGSEGARRRFQREADLAGRVVHPNLCGVLEAGIRAGVPYIVMRRIRGISLKEWIPRQDRTDGDAERALSVVRWGEQVARALDAIHRSGLVHRDVKPGNIVVEGEGRGSRAVLVDFGLAREEGTDRFTATGEIVGSPAYLSPEALSAAPGEPSQDVYALGATLFEALTGRLPFVAPTREGLFRAVLTGEVPPLGAIAGIRERDADLVLATAMAKDASRRYQSAAAMAADLAALQKGEPVSVRPPGAVARAVRWLVGNRVAAIVVVGLALGFGGSLWALATSAAALRHAESRTLALAAARAQGDARVGLARAAVERDATPAALAELHAAVGAFHACRSVRVPAIAGAGVPAGVRFADRGAWRVRVGDVEFDAEGARSPVRSEAIGDPGQAEAGGLAARIDRDRSELVLVRHGVEVRVADAGVDRLAVAVDPRGRYAATAEGDGAVRLWAADGLLLDTLGGRHRTRATALAFDAEGERLVSAAGDGEVCVWTVRPHGVWWRGEGRVLGLVPLEAGVAVALEEGALAVLGDDASLRWRRDVPGITGIAGDGDRLVARDRGGAVWVFDGAGGAPVRWLQGEDGDVPLRPVAAHARGVAAAVGAENRTLWLATGPDASHSWTGPLPITAVAAAGEGVVAGCSDGSVRRFDWGGRELAPVAAAHDDRIRTIALAEDGRMVTGSRDGSAAVWSAWDASAPNLRMGHDAAVSAAVWIAADRVATATARGGLRVWRVAEGQAALVSELRGHSAGVWGLLALDRGGAPQLLSASSDRTVRRWWPAVEDLRGEADALVPPEADEVAATGVLGEK